MVAQDELVDYISQCLDCRARDKLGFCTRQFYEHGNKCGCLLAKMLKEQQTLRHVHSLTTRGTQVVDTLSIAKEFQKFCASHYKNPSATTSVGELTHFAKIQAYLWESAFPGFYSGNSSSSIISITKEELSAYH